MWIAVLGPLEVVGDDGPVALRGPKERAVLAALVLRCGEVVDADSVIEAVWGDAPPRTADKTLQVYVARLRKSLEPGRVPGQPGAVLATRGSGYVLDVDPDDVDARRFERLAATGQEQLAAGAANLAAGTLREALSLWRGPAYTDVRTVEAAVQEAERLGAVRLATVEDRLDADLRLGRHQQVVPELEDLCRAHPLRERMWALLMSALYRSGRQADALLAYDTARGVLRDELGVDPGDELRALHAAVLAQDPALATTWAPTVAPLPAPLDPVSPLYGMHEELRRLRSVWERAARGSGGVLLVHGPEGSGTTRLAAALAQEAYAAGVLVLYGRCAPPPVPPLAPLDDALREAGSSLQALDGRSSALAGHLAQLAGDRPVLLVLDDLHEAQPELLELLPGLSADAPGSRLLVLCGWSTDAAPARLWNAVDRIDPDGSRRLLVEPLDDAAVRQVVALYVAPEETEQVTDLLAEPSRRRPGALHRMAGAYARTRSAGRVARAAEAVALSLAEARAARVELTEAVGALHEAQLSATTDGDLERCPYLGLSSYGQDDRELFHGRERLVAEVTARLAATSLLALVGASGSGKSSLVRAGVLPALREGVLPGGPVRTVELRPGSRPADLVPQVRALAGGEQRAVAFVDQLEEVFSLCDDAAERDRFLDALLDVSDSGVVVVLALRSDWYGACAAHPRLAAALADASVLVGAMTADELRRSIEVPARLLGQRVEPAVVDTVVAEVTGQPGALPVLSAALTSAWQRRSGSTLRLVDLLVVGGVRGAVGRLAESAFEALEPAEQQAARLLLLRLVQTGPDDAPVRRRAARAELDLEQQPVTAAALRRLVQARLLTVDDDAVEIAHDAVLAQWPRLQEWLEHDAEGRRVQRHLIRAAQEWAQDGRDPSALYRGARLLTALEWAQAQPQAVNALEREFLAASSAERDLAGRERRRRQRRALVAAVAAAAVFASLALVAVVEGRRADDRSRLARSRQIAAEASAQLSVDPQLSLLLARAAYDASPTAEAQAALRQAVVRSHLVAALAGGTAGEPYATARFSPDGRLVASGGRDGARLADAGTGRVLAELRTAGPVTAVAFSADGRRLAAAVTGADSVVWDVAERRAVATLRGHEAGLGAGQVAWLGAQAVVTGSPDGTARVWEAASGRATAVLRHGAPVLHLAVGPRGAVATSGADGRVRLWDAKGRSTGELRGHEGPVNASAFTPGGAVVTAGDDRTVRTWTAAGAPGRVLRGHRGQVQSLLLTRDGTRVVSGDSEGGLRVWRTADGGTDAVLVGHVDALFSDALSLSPDGRLLASGSADGTARLWDLQTGTTVAELLGHTGRVESTAFSPDGRTVASGADDGVRLWRTPPGADQVLRGHTDGVLVVRSAGGRVLTGSFDGTARLWNGTRSVALPHPPGTTVRAVTLAPDARLAVTAGTGRGDPRPLVWDGEGRPAGAIDVPQVQDPERCGPAACQVTDVLFSPRGDRVAVARQDGAVLLWDAVQRRLLGDVLRVRDAPLRLAWRPDGAQLAVAGLRGTTTLLDVAGGRAERVLSGHGGQQGAPEYSADGSRLVTTGFDATARVWDLRNGRPPTVLRHRSKVSRAVFSADGRFLVTASGGAAAVWDVAAGTALTSFEGHRSEVTWVEAQADGSVLSASDDGTVRAFRCLVCGSLRELTATAAARTTRSLTAAERRQFLQ